MRWDSSVVEEPSIYKDPRNSWVVYLYLLSDHTINFNPSPFESLRGQKVKVYNNRRTHSFDFNGINIVFWIISIHADLPGYHHWRKGGGCLNREILFDHSLQILIHLLFVQVATACSCKLKSMHESGWPIFSTCQTGTPLHEFKLRPFLCLRQSDDHWLWDAKFHKMSSVTTWAYLNPIVITLTFLPSSLSLSSFFFCT